MGIQEVDLTPEGILTSAGTCEICEIGGFAILKAEIDVGLACEVPELARSRVMDWFGIRAGTVPGDIGAMLMYTDNRFKEAVGKNIGTNLGPLNRDLRLEKLLSMKVDCVASELYGVTSVQEIVCSGDRLQLKIIKGASHVFLTHDPGHVHPKLALVGILPVKADYSAGGVTSSMPKGAKMIVAGPGWHIPPEVYIRSFGVWNYLALIVSLVLTTSKEAGWSFIGLTLCTEMLCSVFVWVIPHRWSAGAYSLVARADPVHPLLTVLPSAGFTARIVMVIEGLGGVIGLVGLFSVYENLGAYLLAAAPTIAILIGLLSPMSLWARFVLVCFAGHMFEFAFEAAYAADSDSIAVSILLGGAAVVGTLTALVVFLEMSKATWATDMFNQGNPARCKSSMFLTNEALASLRVLEGTAATLMQTTAPGRGVERASLIRRGAGECDFSPSNVDSLSGPDGEGDECLLVDSDAYPVSFSGQRGGPHCYPPRTWATGLAIFGGGVLPVLNSDKSKEKCVSPTRSRH